MSIILKGIDLPNSGQIEIIIRPHGKVFSKTKGISAEAIQIPKGHGRLIDPYEIPGAVQAFIEAPEDTESYDIWKEEHNDTQISGE